MGRRNGIFNIMEAIVQYSSGCGGLDNARQTIAQATNFRELTINKHLAALEALGYIKLENGGSSISILKRNVPTQEELDEAARVRPVVMIPVGAAQPLTEPVLPTTPEPAKPVVIKPMIPAELPRPTQERIAKLPNVAVLVDLDNTESRALETGFQISYARLKEKLREFGNLIFADVFVSPTAVKNSGLVAQLWDAGFTVIACPMETKDRDAVDAKMNWRGREYVAGGGIDTIVVVSVDRDFKDLGEFAADRHKRVIFFRVTEHKEAIQGKNGEVPLGLGRSVAQKLQTVKELTENAQSFTNDQQARFIQDVIRQMAEVFRRHPDRMGFKVLKIRTLQLLLPSEWKKIHDDSLDRELEQAMSALKEGGVLQKTDTGSSVHYTLNRSHPAVIRAIRPALTQIKLDQLV